MEGDLRSAYGAVSGPARQCSSGDAADAATAEACAVASDARPRRRLTRAISAVSFAALALGCVVASMWARPDAGGGARPRSELVGVGAPQGSPVDTARAPGAASGEA